MKFVFKHLFLKIYLSKFIFGLPKKELMHYIFFIVFLFTMMWQFSWANPGWVKKADEFYRQNQFDSAEFYYQKVLQQVPENDWPRIIELRNKISGIFLKTRQFEQAWPYLTETRLLAEKNLSANHPELTNIFNQLGRYTWFHGQFSQGLNFLERAKSIYFLNNSQNPELLMSIYANFGFAHGFHGAIDSSLYYFQEAVHLAGTLDNPLKLADRYSDLSFAYSKKGDYESALQIMQKSLAINKKHLPANHASIGKNYNNLTYLTIELWDHDLAIRYALEALNIIEQNEGLDSYSAAIAYMNLAAANGNKEDWEQALYYCEKAEQAFLKAVGAKTPYLGNVHLIRAFAYQFLEQPKLELTYLTKSIDFKKQVYGNYHPELVIAYRELGDHHRRNQQYQQAIDNLEQSLAIADSVPIENYLLNESLLMLTEVYQDMGNIQKSLSTIQRALIVLVPGFDQEDLSYNPAIEDSQAKMNLLFTLKLKTRLLSELYNQQPVEENLQTALATVTLTNQLIDSIRTSYKTGESKQLLVKNAIPFYEDAIHLAYQAFEFYQNKDYLNLTFQFFEKNKSLLLLEGIRENRAREFAGIPPSVLEKERQLKFNLNYYQEKLQVAQSQTDSASVKDFSRLLTENQLDYQELMETLEKQYPAYHQYKYQWQPVSLNTIQQEVLSEKTALIEFFVGTDNIYAFCSNSEQAQMYSLEKNQEFQQLTENLRNHLLNYHSSTNNFNQAITAYHRDAVALYNLLLKQPLNRLKGQVEELIIVPDGQLGYLPFEALMNEPDNLNSYLIRDYSFSYTYSATLLHQLTKEVPGGNSARQYAGFAPDYEEGLLALLDSDESQLLRDGNYQLPGAVNEVEKISGIMQGEAWLAQEATESNFKANAGQYQILHLAMHGLLNDQDPMFSKLLFSQSDTSEDGFLNAAEIYNLQLNADLAVLSACNTASGKISRGEGIMSLSRAFMYAGCPSLVASLWKAPDAATSQIMVSFYENLNEGFGKATAMRQAKLKYLEENPGVAAHPFYWSTFVPIGDMQPIETTGFWHNVWWQLLMITFLSILVFLLIKTLLAR